MVNITIVSNESDIMIRGAVGQVREGAIGDRAEAETAEMKKISTDLDYLTSPLSLSFINHITIFLWCWC